MLLRASNITRLYINNYYYHGYSRDNRNSEGYGSHVAVGAYVTRAAHLIRRLR